MKRPLRPAVRRTTTAAGLLGVTRVLSLAFSLLLLHQLGLSLVGRFAIVLAVSALIVVPIDAYYLIRTPRVSDGVFPRDQATRCAIALGLICLGAAVAVGSVIAGFTCARAGCEMALNAQKGVGIRAGAPERAATHDVVRSTLALVSGALAILAFGVTGLVGVAVAYIVGYVPSVVSAVRTLRAARPIAPERNRRTAALGLEAVLSAAYLQGDIVVLGLLLPAASVGIYALASALALGAGLLGQTFSQTFHEPLRRAGGDVSAAPRLVHTAAVSALAATVIALVALGVWAAGGSAEAWSTVMVFAVVGGLRCTGAVFTTVLMLQTRDFFRLRLSVLANVVKFALLLVLARRGAPWTVVPFVAGDLLAVMCAFTALYRRPAHAAGVA